MTLIGKAPTFVSVGSSAANGSIIETKGDQACKAGYTGVAQAKCLEISKCLSKLPEFQNVGLFLMRNSRCLRLFSQGDIEEMGFGPI